MIDQQAIVQGAKNAAYDLRPFVSHHRLHPGFGQTGESDDAGAPKPHGINLFEVDLAAVA